ncbi:MAG TPA: hypothetical protein VHK67_02960 [Rhabdochlamydiaceae bacterium]|jgi:hypothetical protein|nr:hypothetical protein [Rhabdochlamydiaceae bacterium]
MQLSKVRSIPAVELNKAVAEVQETSLRNTQLDCKMNEARAQLDHVRFITKQVAYLHFLRCKPFIV